MESEQTVKPSTNVDTQAIKNIYLQPSSGYCPHCNRCPHCGRPYRYGYYPYYPYYPYYGPYYSYQPVWTNNQQTQSFSGASDASNLQVWAEAYKNGEAHA